RGGVDRDVRRKPCRRDHSAETRLTQGAARSTLDGMLMDAEAREAPPLSAARPILKWAGGKRQLLPVLRRFVPSAFTTYHEPFVGSAALFFDLWSSGRIATARLADTNEVLVGCYAALRHDVDAVIVALERLASRHRATGSTHYYEARARFNAAIAKWRAAGAD